MKIFGFEAEFTPAGEAPAQDAVVQIGDILHDALTANPAAHTVDIVAEGNSSFTILLSVKVFGESDETSVTAIAENMIFEAFSRAGIGVDALVTEKAAVRELVLA